MSETKKNNLIYFLLLFTSLTLLNPAFAGIKDFSNAIDKAGKQRMLTQRMLKNYVLVGMGNDFGDPGDDLQQIIKLFDETLSELRGFNKDAQIKQSISNIETLWSPIKQQLEQAPKLEQVAGLQKELDKLLDACHENTKLFVKVSGQGSLKIIDLSGRQRMLSQRLAALYMLKVWGVDDSEFKKKLEKTMNEFSQAEKTLEQSDLNTTEIKTGLAKVKRLFRWFEIMGKTTTGHYVPSIISKSSDKILSEMNSVTNLYIEAAK